MTLQHFTDIIILLWPAITVATVMAVLFMPTRARAGWGGIAGAVLFTAAVLWGVFIEFLLTVPYRGDFDHVEFWASVSHVWKPVIAHITAPWAVTAMVSYFVVGFAWAVAYFWLYARRLGRRYVLERDIWLRAHQRTSLEGLTAELRLKFDTVVATVKKEMIYAGDFPLRPLQQKRFFAANLLLWPMTVLAYLVGDMALDVARHTWFRLRNWVLQRWEKGMPEFFADEALCREKLAEFERAQA
jgi:hypothetical protein